MLKEHIARRTALEGGDDEREVEAIAPDESKQHVLRFLVWNVIGDQRDPRPPPHKMPGTILVRCGSHGLPQFRCRAPGCLALQECGPQANGNLIPKSP